MSQNYKLRRAKIRRVDLVDEGAAPDAHILIAKNRSDDANSIEEIRKRVREFLDRTATTHVETINVFVGATKTEIEEAVDEVAREEWLAGEHSSIEAARAAVWTDDPDLYATYAAAVKRGGKADHEIAKSGERMVKDHIYDAVHARADLMRLREFDTPVHKLVDQVWNSPEGRDLYRVYSNTHLGVMPMAKARSRVAKSDSDRALHDAIRQADQWLR